MEQDYQSRMTRLKEQLRTNVQPAPEDIEFLVEQSDGKEAS